MEHKEKTGVTRESDKFMLRLPDGMRERIADAAKKSGRSMNAEIVARLELSFSQNFATQQGWDTEQFVESLAAKLAVKLKSQ